MWPRVDGLRAMSLGAPGEMREWLNDLVLSGRKQATAGLLAHDYRAESEDLEHVGERLALLDNGGAKLAEVEVTTVSVVPLTDVTWAFADAEGEGFRSVAHWREIHTEYWANEGHAVADDTEVVCLWFRLT